MNQVPQRVWMLGLLSSLFGGCSSSTSSDGAATADTGPYDGASSTIDGSVAELDSSSGAGPASGLDSAADGGPSVADEAAATESGPAVGADSGGAESGPGGQGVPIVPAFYVSATGNDSNPGTIAAPFATLRKAQTAMQASTAIKTTYVRAGSYVLPNTNNGGNCNGTCGVQLAQADNGETWSYYPPDGVDSADLTGKSTASGNGLFSIFVVDNTVNVTIDGLSIHNFQYGAVVGGGGTNKLTVRNNLIFNGYYGPGAASSPGGFTCYGCANTTISHNVIHDIAAFGVNLANVNGDISNLLVTGNVLYNICTAVADCGAIYVVDTRATASNIQWTNNFVRDGNTSAALGGGYGAALYADDCTSNVVATGNILTGRNGSNTILIHGGSNDRFLGNFTDLTSYRQSVAAFQTSSQTGCSDGKMSGNEYENSVIIGGGGGGGFRLLSGSPLNVPAIKNDDYHNYAGALIGTGGAYSDSNPIGDDPQVSGWTYNIASSSQVLNPPVKFPPIVGGWGPPGYVIQQAGTPPSSPH